MQICPQSESILLPLAPTIAGTIADRLRLVLRQFDINSPHQCDRIDSFLSDSSTNRPSEIPLRRVPTSPYQYVSPIAHRLVAKLQLTPLEICQSIQLQLRSPQLDTTVASLELLCWYNDAGYFYFQLWDRSIVTWLNYLHDLPLDAVPERICQQDPAIEKNPASCSVALYAHARCCSVLTLARTEQLISLSDTWQVTTPGELACYPSLSCPHDLSHTINQLTAQPIVIFEQLVEERLIHALMDVLDGIWSVRGEDRLKTAQFHRFALDLARRWLEFHRHCRIFGVAKSQNPQRAIARCGLTAICRRYLQLLLEDYLGITALAEL